MGIEQLASRDGDLWVVEYSESENLLHVGGFLLMCGDLSSITISMLLAEEDKQRGREALSKYLSTMPIGTKGTVLWLPDDEEPGGCLRNPYSSLTAPPRSSLLCLGNDGRKRPTVPTSRA